MISRRRRPFLLSCAAALLLSLPPAAAPAAELEPDLVLEGFPFSAATTLALSADGRDIYATGDAKTYPGPTAGLVWLRRDPATGGLDLRRNYFSRDGAPATLSMALGPNDRYLYVLRPTEISILLRSEDGSLESRPSAPLPDDWSPVSVFLAPGGSQLIVLGVPPESPSRTQALIFDLDSSGRPTLVQTLDGDFRSNNLVVLADDLLVSGRASLRRAGGTWQAAPIPGFAAHPEWTAWRASADRRYLYVRVFRGPYNHTTEHLVTLEQQGGVWVAVAEVTFRDDFDRWVTALALHPESGDLYVASAKPLDGSEILIDHFRSQAGGRSFTAAEPLVDPVDLGSRTAVKQLLAFMPDGRQMYTNFAGEPMALLEVDPADGRLDPVADAAGLHSHFERPFKILPLASGDTYVLTPAAVLQTRWNGAAPELLSSLDLESWNAATSRALVDFVLAPGDAIGAITNGEDLALVERDRATGALRILNDSTVHPGGVRSLALSPDGRHLYTAGYQGGDVYSVLPDSGQLAPVQHLVFELVGTVLRIAPNGVDVVLIGWNRRAGFLSRNVETGELAAAAGPYREQLEDAFFLPGGRLALVGRDWVHMRNGTLDVLYRGPGGEWLSGTATTFETASDARQVFDSNGHFVYHLHGETLDQLALTPQRFSFERVARRTQVVHRVTPFLPQVSNLALEPGEESLLVADSPGGYVRRFRRGCGSLAAGPCLADRRFRTEVIWRTAEEQGPGLPLPIGTGDSQVFSFFDTNNWELLAKVLDGCAINGRYWVFAAGSTDLAYDLLVSDTWTGQRRVYPSAGGAPAPALTDTDAFATCDAPSPGWNPPVQERDPLVENANGLLLDGRYEAKVSWTTAAGQQGAGTGLETFPATASGLFYFFDPANWEMQVKVLDGCAINGYHWVFGAATTDVGYQLEVKERSSGRRKVYSNRVGTPSRAITDTEAFSCD